jgi:hypothetical protein
MLIKFLSFTLLFTCLSLNFCLADEVCTECEFTCHIGKQHLFLEKIQYLTTIPIDEDVEFATISIEVKFLLNQLRDLNSVRDDIHISNEINRKMEKLCLEYLNEKNRQNKIKRKLGGSFDSVAYIASSGINGDSCNIPMPSGNLRTIERDPVTKIGYVCRASMVWMVNISDSFGYVLRIEPDRHNYSVLSKLSNPGKDCMFKAFWASKESENRKEKERKN